MNLENDIIINQISNLIKHIQFKYPDGCVNMDCSTCKYNGFDIEHKTICNILLHIME